LIALLPTLAIAAPEGVEDAELIPTPKQGLATLVTAIVAFAVVCFVLYALVWPKITSGLDERAAKIREEIASAEAARAQAKSALEEYEASLAQARAESQRMLDETKSKQTELAAELKAKADRELAHMRDRAMRDIEAAKKAALSEIYNESVDLAAMMAAKILQREVSASDEERLLKESLDELQTA
ncbi:MAG: F0F1 ATP synthase subunit B, partial [Planctomycetota bacterium]